MKALLIGFGCYCLLVLAKALRFRALLNLNSGVHQVFPILAMHTFWGNILPMRTGDVSYVYLMQRHQKIDATQGVASLLVASLIDFGATHGLGGRHGVATAHCASRHILWHSPLSHPASDEWWLGRRGHFRLRCPERLYENRRTVCRSAIGT